MSQPMKRAGGLGRGLSALLEDRPTPTASGGEAGPGVRMIAIGDIRPHPKQPRRHFEETALDELAQSIKTRGLIQPIVVRPAQDGSYELVAGERRWRAAQRAQLHELAALVKELDEATTFELALIENVQRENLNAIEEAEAYHRLIAEFGHTQEALAAIVHKSRSHIANLIRLLDLPVTVREAVAAGRLTMGHARALITAPDPAALAADVEARGLSVRDTEKLAKGAKAKPPTTGAVEYKSLDADIGALERHLGDLLGLKVKVQHSGRSGTVLLSYGSLDQLDLICQRLSGERI